MPAERVESLAAAVEEDRIVRLRDQRSFETGIVVTNDSDLLLPIQMVTSLFGKPIGLLNPQEHPSRALLPHVAFIKQIRPGVLAKSQFPVTLTDKQGSFSKPVSWQ